MCDLVSRCLERHDVDILEVAQDLPQALGQPQIWIAGARINFLKGRPATA